MKRLGSAKQMKKRTVRVLAGLACLWLIAVEFPRYVGGDWGILTSTLTGLALIVVGAIAAVRRPENRIGAILLVTAFLWPFKAFETHTGVVYQQLNVAASWVWAVPLAYLVLAFPGGRLERRKDAWICWLVTIPAFWLSALCLPFFEFTPTTAEVPPSSQPVVRTVQLVSLVMALALSGAMIASVRDKWRRATPPGRRALAPVAITGAFSLSIVTLYTLGINYSSFVRDHHVFFIRVTWLAVATVPIGFLVGLSRARARRARMGDLVVELGDLPTPDRFQAALRNALGDPNLVAAFWVPAAGHYVTAEGHLLSLPDEGSESVATFLERDGEPLAVIVHDAYLMEDPALVAGATAAARLAVENERLQQEVLEQLVEVRASRSRIIQAGDEARRRLERDLHDGAQQRLVTLGLKLQSLEARLGPLDEETSRGMQDIRAELKGALSELRDLARGLHPLVLTEEGLGPAIESLCGRFPLPVAFGELDVGRLPQPIETAAYFVVSEALANVAKHAHATMVDISAERDVDTLTVEIADNGIGGASMEAGSGLRGLADRVEALNGSVSVASPSGAGTRIVAQLPTAIPEFEELAPVSIVNEPLLAMRRQGSILETSLLRVQGLTVFYGDQQVLFDIDLDIAPGEVVAVLGTNGAGKSTLARTVAGLHEHMRGSIRFNGAELTDVLPEQRARAGLVFIEGGAGVFEPLTVEENLRLFARHAGVGRDEGFARVFDAFPVLAARRRQRASSMSRGEQHMLGLARAVMCNAFLIVVDELTLGLAPEIADDVCEHLRRLNERGSAILFIEQSVMIASRLAHRTYFLDAGRIAFEGPIADLESSGLLVPTWMRGIKDLTYA